MSKGVKKEKLKELLVPIEFKWRLGSKNQCYPYADKDILQNRLDEILGAENWNCEHYAVNSSTYCKVGINVEGEWIYKTASGKSMFEIERTLLFSKEGKELTDGLEEIKKTAKSDESDSFKRACFNWGLGRFIQEIDSFFVKKVLEGDVYYLTHNDKKICKQNEASYKLSQYINSVCYLPDYISDYIETLEDVKNLELFYKSQRHLHKNNNFLNRIKSKKETFLTNKKV